MVLMHKIAYQEVGFSNTNAIFLHGVRDLLYTSETLPTAWGAFRIRAKPCPRRGGPFAHERNLAHDVGDLSNASETLPTAWGTFRIQAKPCPRCWRTMIIRNLSFFGVFYSLINNMYYHLNFFQTNITHDLDPKHQYSLLGYHSNSVFHNFY